MRARGASAAVTGENIAAAENIYGNKRDCAAHVQGSEGQGKLAYCWGGTCPNGWSVLENTRRGYEKSQESLE